MKYTSNIVTLPRDITDAYLEALMTTTDPILKEEDLAAETLLELLGAAAAACRKMIIAKHLKGLEEAGLFKGVTCIDYPGFVWTAGSMRLYAASTFSICLMKTLAEDLAEDRRTLDDFISYLEIVQKIEVQASVNVALKDAPEAAHRRLCGTVGSITQANCRYMLGLTVDNQLRLLNNIKGNKEMQVDDGPMANFKDDMSAIMPEPVLDV